MEKVVKRGATYRASRISYAENYLLAALLSLVILMVWVKIPNGWWSTAVTYGILLFILVLLFEAELKRAIKRYVITNEEVMELEGIIRKKKVIIPYRGIAGVGVEKNISGRLLNFGAVIVSGPKNEIRMEGVKDPEVVCRIIQNKMDLTKKKKTDDVQPKTTKKKKTDDVQVKIFKNDT